MSKEFKNLVKVRKKEVDEDKPMLYYYKKLRYIEKPKGVKVTKYYWDNENGCYTAVCTKGSVFGFFIFLFLFIALLGSAYYFRDSLTHKAIIDLPEAVYVSGNEMTANAVNPPESNYNVILKYYKGKQKLYETKLKPGEGVGEVRLMKTLSPGTYKVRIEQYVDLLALDYKVVKEYDMIVTE